LGGNRINEIESETNTTVNKLNHLHIDSERNQK